jgi:putative RecB family exonuclease
MSTEPDTVTASDLPASDLGANDLGANDPPANDTADGSIRLDLGDVLADGDPTGAYGDAEPDAPPLIGPDGRVRLSFSRIDTYQRCPLQFRFAYIDKLPSAPATYLSFGTSVHTALEAFHDRTLFGMPSEEDLLGFLYDGWDASGFAHVGRDVQMREYRRAQDVLRRYHRRVRDTYRPAAETEKWFEVPIGDHATVVGSIDRIDVDDDGSYHVVDYKTGKLRDRQQVRRSLQLAIYALACEHLYGVLPATVSLDFVVPGTEVRVPLEELDLDAARRAVDQTAQAILAQDFTPTPNRLCDWCDHRSLCPAWEGSGPDVLGPTIVALQDARRAARRAAGDVRALEAAVERARDQLLEQGLDPVVEVPATPASVDAADGGGSASADADDGDPSASADAPTT